MGFSNYYLKGEVLTQVFKAPPDSKASVNLVISNTTGTSSFITVIKTSKSPLFVTEQDHLWSNVVFVSDNTPQELTGLILGPNQYLLIKSSIDNVRASVTSVEVPVDGHMDLTTSGDFTYASGGLQLAKIVPVVDTLGSLTNLWSVDNTNLLFSSNNISSVQNVLSAVYGEYILETGISFSDNTDCSLEFRQGTTTDYYSFIINYNQITIKQTISSITTTLGSKTILSPASLKLAKINNKLKVQLNNDLILDLSYSGNTQGSFSLIAFGASTTSIVTLTSPRLVYINQNNPSLSRASVAQSPSLQESPSNQLRLFNNKGIIEEEVSNLILNNNLASWGGAVPDNWSAFVSSAILTKTSSPVGSGNMVTITDNSNTGYAGALHQSLFSPLTTGNIISLSFDCRILAGSPMVRLELDGGITTGSSYLVTSLTGSGNHTTLSSNLELVGSQVDQLPVAGWYRYKYLVRLTSDQPFIRLVLFAKTVSSSTGQASFANLQFNLNQHLVEYQTTTKLADKLTIANTDLLRANQGSIWFRAPGTQGQLSGEQTRKVYILSADNLEVYRENNTLFLRIGSSLLSYTYSDTLSQPIGLLWTSSWLRVYRGSTIVAELLNPSLPTSIGPILYIGSDTAGLYYLNGRLDTLQLSHKVLTQLDQDVNTNHSLYWYFSTLANTKYGEYESSPMYMRFNTARVLFIDEITEEPIHTKITYLYRWADSLLDLDLKEYVLPANTLSIQGKYIQVKAILTSSSLVSPVLLHYSVNSINTPGLVNNLGVNPVLQLISNSPFDTTGLQVEANESLI